MWFLDHYRGEKLPTPQLATICVPEYLSNPQEPCDCLYCTRVSANYAAECAKGGFPRYTYDDTTWLPEIVHHMKDRCQFVTDTGFLGFGPPDLQPGDEIVLFVHSSFSYAVRKAGEGQYKLVGPVIVRPPRHEARSYSTLAVRPSEMRKLDLELKEYILV